MSCSCYSCIIRALAIYLFIELYFESQPRETAPVSSTTAIRPVFLSQANLCWIHPKSALLEGGYHAPKWGGTIIETKTIITKYILSSGYWNTGFNRSDGTIPKKSENLTNKR